MTRSQDDPSVQENPYLALREAKIRRNEARLRELGLLKANNKQSTSDLIQEDSRKQQDKSQRKRAFPGDKAASLALRRSNRLSEQPQTVNFKETTDFAHSQKTKRPRVVTPATIDDSFTTEITDSQNNKSPTQIKPPAANSVRGISLCTQLLTMGTSENKTKKRNAGLLGLPMERVGKEFVIYKSFDVAASVEDRQRLEGARLSFNKYSGVQEWNDCVFLWVNLGAKGNTVVNDFMKSGTQITWFGGSRMVDETPVVERLIRWGKEATDSHSKIILWCRRFDSSMKAFGPYICLGRLSYHSHLQGSRPLAFLWNLLDFDRLTNNPDVDVQNNFRHLLQSTSIEGNNETC